jgi:hypothetical protein
VHAGVVDLVVDVHQPIPQRGEAPTSSAQSRLQPQQRHLAGSESTSTRTQLLALLPGKTAELVLAGEPAVPYYLGAVAMIGEDEV